jgi:hypothetical protein
MAHRPLGTSLKSRLEEAHKASFGDVLAGRLRDGATIPRLAEEWGCKAQHIYQLAKEAGFATYWLRNGKEILARVP